MGTGKVFLNLLVCLIAYIPTFRKFWGLGNKLMVKKQNKTRAQTSCMMWFRSPCINECCASWEKMCLIYELTFCRKNASFEREKLYSAWLDFLFVVFSYDVRDDFGKKKPICYDYIRSYKNIFQNTFLDQFVFPFFQTVFYCRRCKLFMLLRTDYGSWHRLY